MVAAGGEGVHVEIGPSFGSPSHPQNGRTKSAKPYAANIEPKGWPPRLREGFLVSSLRAGTASFDP
jgi:hypothetical protein